MAATDAVKPGETIGTLSLTGRLSLQERKDKKDRKGRITFKKKSSHWFWFDEQDCSLKYYKNSETYYTHLHKYEGIIDLKSAKVSPSEVYLDSVGTLSIDPDVVSNKTFIILTSVDNIYALSADKDTVCHQWIKKLQEKRAKWDKRSMTKIKQSRSKDELMNMKEEGLVYSIPDSRTSSSSSVSMTSHVRRIFGDVLGSDQVLMRGQSCPSPSTLDNQGFVGSPNVSTTALPTSPPTAPPTALPTGPMFTIPDDVTDGTGTKLRGDSVGSVSSTEVIDDTTLSKPPLTESEREVLKVQVELSEARQEIERLQQRITYLEDDQQKQYDQKMELINEVQDLMETVHRLKADSPAKAFHNENETLKDVIKQLKRSLCSIDGEVELHKAQLAERDKRIQEGNKKIRELEDTLLRFKAKYVSLLDWSFKIPTPGPGGLASDDSDPVEEKLKEDLLNLINEESASDNPLADISGDQSVFEDQYGELHDWNNDSNICHFLCRQLYLHYTEYDQDSSFQEWYNHTKSLKTTKDGQWEIPSESHRGKRRELRSYLRRGIPHPMRSNMWASLVYSQVGRMRDIKNSAAPDKNYYRSLLSIPSKFTKQILLDQYRTLPNNKHFRMEGGQGARKLEQVLIAYSNHNVNVGYCQGMNMITAAGLLFLDEESTFWYLVAIIEKLMPQHYFTTGLAAAQADQAVMKSLVEEKLPDLSNHLEENGIDVTVVSFNWFLTLFIDALPTESMLRVMDCFLLEGRKVFFRFSLAIFKIFERRILNLHDPVTIFQFIKEVARHIFNVEELFRVAFTELEPFPSRSTIQARHKVHLEKFLAEWKKREAMKAESSLVPPPTPPAGAGQQPLLLPRQKKQLLWECGAAIASDEVWLCCGERQTGRFCIVKNKEDGLDLHSPSITIESKILCVKAISEDVMIVGTLDFHVHAVSTNSQKELWSMKMSDSILDIVFYEGNIILAMADGYIAAVSTPDGLTPPTNDPIMYRIGNMAVQCMTISSCDHIWVGCGKAITVLEAKTYDPVQAIVIPDEAGKPYKMEISKHGIWVTFKNSMLLYLYDDQKMVQILSVDYSTLLPSTLENKLNSDNLDNRITVLMVYDDSLWIGTGSASFHVFKILSSAVPPANTRTMPSKKLAEGDERMTRSTVTQKSSQSLVVDTNDEGLLTDKNLSMTLTQMEVEKEREAAQMKGEVGTTGDLLAPSKLKRKAFGNTFYRRIRKRTSSDVRNGLYKLEHKWTECIHHGDKDYPKVTLIKPIMRNGKYLVISCVNSTSKLDKAVQLWQMDTKEPFNWRCRYLQECHSIVMKESQRQQSTVMSRPNSIDRGRSYSTMLGSTMLSSHQVMELEDEL